MGGGPCDFSVSPRSKSFFFLFLGDFYLTWGPVWTRARTRTWTRAWQYGAKSFLSTFQFLSRHQHGTWKKWSLNPLLSWLWGNPPVGSKLTWSSNGVFLAVRKVKMQNTNEHDDDNKQWTTSNESPCKRLTGEKKSVFLTINYRVVSIVTVASPCTQLLPTKSREREK